MLKTKFIEIPSYTMLPDGKGEWISRGKLRLYSHRIDEVLEVPKGSVNNLASIPRIARRVFSVNGPHRPAAAWHDYSYEVKGKFNNIKISLDMSNSIFYDAMLSLRSDYWDALDVDTKKDVTASGREHHFVDNDDPLVSKWKAWMMWQGVNLGGWVAWHKD